MSNSPSLVQQAISAFKKKDYDLALQLWRQAGAELGEKNFLANIHITEKLLTSNSHATKNTLSIIKKEKLKDLNNNLYNNLPTVSVIIPTYKNNEYIDECINSILYQNYPSEKIEIIISVNGNNADYAQFLRIKYATKKNIKIIYTSKKGAASGRNFALQYVHGTYIMYIDDDDYISNGYINELVSYATSDVDIICGRLVDYNADTNLYNEHTYINKTIEKGAGQKSNDLLKYSSLFSSLWAKLYRTEFINKCSLINEELKHTEDVDFWIENISNLNTIYLCDSFSNECYIRRIVENSLSRPSEEKKFDFYITDRIQLIEKFSKKMFEQLSYTHKLFIMYKIASQTDFLLKHFKTLDGELKKNASEAVTNSTADFLNKSLFGSRNGIAYCHNFSPYIDASAYVASKRLAQISAKEGELIRWTVCQAAMQTRQIDKLFDIFFAKYQYADRLIIGKKTYFNEQSQYEWGKQAFAATDSLKADIIYSRSMWAGSHVAAYMYKKNHPETKWYAEFSDPIYIGTDYKIRGYTKHYENEQQHLNTFWRDIEMYVFTLADVIIFTNDNQKEFMLRENPSLHDTEYVRCKSIVMQHPILPNYWKNLVISEYPLNTSVINIGYFGTFYANRKGTVMLDLLKYHNTHLHIFTPGAQLDIPEKYAPLRDRIHINNLVGYFEYLNIASKMDYLYLNDIDFSGDINPYLPSKLSDYLSVGTKIIAKINNNSPLDLLPHPNVIRYEKIETLVR